MKYKIITLGTIFLLLSACVSIGNKMDETDITNIQRCKTSKQELLSMFGKPYEKGVQSGYNTLKWLYVYSGVFSHQRQEVIAFLNNDGTVVDYAFNPQGSIEIYDKCGN